ncbi:MAG: hypothetical protein HY060_10270 [Proteobacteria bacterium]|nr:hypothetical protein [Pseudomonadota bacterium]
MTDQRLQSSQSVVDRVVPRPFRKHPYLAWLTSFLVLVTIITWFGWRMTEPRPYFGLCLTQAIGLITVPLVFRFAHSTLIEWGANIATFATPRAKHGAHDGSDISGWIARELSYFHGSRPMYAAGAATAVLALFAFLLGDYAIGFDDPASFFGCAVIGLTAFPAGMGLYAMFCTCRMIWRLGSFRIRVEDHAFGVLSTGTALARCYFAVALVWGVYTTSAVLGLRHWRIDGAMLPMLVMAAPTFLGIIASYVICQVPLHRRMIEFKKGELGLVDRVLDQFRHVTPESLTTEIKSKVEFFENRKSRMIGLPEWPFSNRALLGAVGSSATAISPVVGLVQKLLSSGAGPG